MLGAPLLLLCLSGAAPLPADEAMAAQHRQMLRDIIQMVDETKDHTGIASLSGPVLHAMRCVPRRAFVPQQAHAYAYINRPLPIGHQQTISQPYMVALMTELAALQPGEKVLEIGTGSGYQAAILAEIVAAVFSIEIIAPLGERAASTLQRLGYDNVHVRIGDGYHGWPEQAPFDAILVTAAPEQVPPPLLVQLKTGGRLIIPVGRQGRVQSLQRLLKGADGSIRTEKILPVGFVPFTRQE